MSGLASFWLERIRQHNPIVVAVGHHIATESALDPAYDVEAAIVAKLAEWNVAADHQAARALRFVVIYYQEDIAAGTGE